MAHRPKPFFRAGRGWFVQLGKKQIKLANGPDNSESEAIAWQEFHKLMAENKAAAPQETKTESLAIIEVFDKFLDWCKKHKAARTYAWYHDHIQAFVKHSGDLAKCPVSELKPFHIVEWVDSHGEDWGANYRRGAIIALQRPFNWAEDLGYITHSPIKKIPKPSPERRKTFVRLEDWEKIKAYYGDDPFRDILEFAWETGSRPQELKLLEARHVDLEHHVAVFPKEEAKGKKRPRIIRMTPRAEEIITKCLQANPEGILFRNEDGNPWTKDAMNCRFVRLKKHLGVKFATYDFRHGFCQDLLEQGNNTNAVAELMGHGDSRMIDRNYSHMPQANSHLEKVLMRRQHNQKER